MSVSSLRPAAGRQSCPEDVGGARPSDAAVLVIDDDLGARDFIVDVLEETGYFVVPASDGEAARRLVGIIRFDVVVSDVLLPGLDGLQLLMLLKQEDPFLQVLLVSGQGTSATAADAWRHGASGLLAKPFAPDQLVAAVENALRRARLHRRTAVEPARHDVAGGGVETS